MDQKKKQQLNLFAIITTVLLGSVLLFTIQNSVIIEVRLLFWTLQSHLGLLVITAFLLGAIAILAIGLPDRFRRETELKVYKKQIARLEHNLQEEKIKNKELVQRKEVEEILTGVTTTSSASSETIN